MNFSKKICSWYQKNKRDLPWRNTNNPYFIWLSEIILQQTRVNQGLNYYVKFIEKYPDVFSLANASHDEVFKLWQGLGYYNRAQNMLATAKIIVEQYHGQFPSTYNELLKLPGIGPYTAAAMASMAFNEAIPVIDGNVYRVLARVFGINEVINSTVGTNKFLEYANELIDHNNPGIYNQAVMEFGALHCTPSRPSCSSCIFISDCYAYEKGMVKRLPVKKPKMRVKSRYFYYFIFHLYSDKKNADRVYLRKRINGDIWNNLYDFPLIETGEKLQLNNTILRDMIQREFGVKNPDINSVSKEYMHKLTHQNIYARFILVNVNNKLKKNEKFLILSHKNKLSGYPVPRLIEQFLIDYKLL